MFHFTEKKLKVLCLDVESWFRHTVKLFFLYDPIYAFIKTINILETKNQKNP